MAASLITFLNKIGLIAKKVRVNQVWDDDMNEIKSAINNHAGLIDDLGVSNTYTQNNITFKNTAGDYFGTLAAPRTGTLTFDSTDEVDGGISTIWYQNATLDIPSTWTLQGEFDDTGVNKLYFERANDGSILGNVVSHNNTDDNTWRPVEIDGTSIDDTETLNIIGGTNVTLVELDGAVTINAAGGAGDESNAIQFNDYEIFKADGNTSQTIEVGDFVKIRIGTKYIEGIYNGGTITSEASYTIWREISFDTLATITVT